MCRGGVRKCGPALSFSAALPSFPVDLGLCAELQGTKTEGHAPDAAGRRAPALRRLQEQGVGKDSEWGSVLRRPLFSRASDGGSASLAHLVALFVERQHTLWKVRAVCRTRRALSASVLSAAVVVRMRRRARAHLPFRDAVRIGHSRQATEPLA